MRAKQKSSYGLGEDKKSAKGSLPRTDYRWKTKKRRSLSIKETTSYRGPKKVVAKGKTLEKHKFGGK